MVTNARPIGKGNFLVIVDGIPVATCVKVKPPKRTAGVTSSRAGGAARKRKSLSGHVDFETLTLTKIIASDVSDAAMFIWLTLGIDSTLNIGSPASTVERIIMIVPTDVSKVPRRTYICTGCLPIVLDPEELDGDSDDAMMETLEFEVDDVQYIPV